MKDERTGYLDKPTTEAVNIVGLTERERRFADSYVIVCLNLGREAGAGPLAYRRAFPSSSADHATVYALSNALLNNSRVREHVASVREELANKEPVPSSRIIDELEKVAFSTITDYLEVDLVSGAVSIDLRSLDVTSAAVISELVIEETVKGDVVRRRTRIKLFNKLDALDRLARIHRLYQEEGAGSPSSYLGLMRLVGDGRVIEGKVG